MIEQLQPRGGTENVFRIIVVMMTACYRPIPLARKRWLLIWQAVEKVRQRRSRVVQTLNVPQRVRLGPSLAAALLDGHFEQPAGSVGTIRDRLLPMLPHP
jgi:hypothetical protein